MICNARVLSWKSVKIRIYYWIKNIRSAKLLFIIIKVHVKHTRDE